MPARRGAWLAAAVALATIAAYAPAIRGGFVWDDDFHVTENRNLEDLAGLARVWTTTGATPQYYPLTHTTFWIERRLWGLDPLGYHLGNVLLHAASAILLARLLARLEVPGGWLAAAVFALHPVHVESVAWITERKNVLSGVLALSAALVFLRWALAPRDHPDRGRLLLPSAAVFLFAAALLSKTVAASLPVAIAIVLWWKAGRLEKRTLPWLAGMLALGAVLGTLTAHLEKHQVGAVGKEFALGLVERTLVAGRALWFYLGKLVWPHPLAFNYARWEPDAASAIGWAATLAAGLAVASLWLLRKRIGRGPFAAAAFYGVTLSPALGFFDVFPMRYSFVADHFQYFASIGPIALAAAGGAIASRRSGRAETARGSALALLALLSALTFRQAGAYKDLETLWRRTIEASPEAFLAHYNLGKLLQERGEAEEALKHYGEALRVKPDLADALVNTANLLAARGRTDEAIEGYLRALGTDPNLPLAHYNLGLALEERGRIEDAERAYREAIRLRPSLGGAHNNLAILLYHRGAFAESWREVREARLAGEVPHPDFLRALSSRMAEPAPGVESAR